MSPALASLVNAIVLVSLGLWGYLGSADPSKTALIPVGAGAALLLMNPGLWKHDKTIAHIAVGVTLLILIGLIFPLKGAIGRSDSMAIARVGIMLATTVIAMVFFVKSFVDARRNRTTTDPAD